MLLLRPGRASRRVGRAVLVAAWPVALPRGDDAASWPWMVVWTSLVLASVSGRAIPHVRRQRSAGPSCRRSTASLAEGGANLVPACAGGARVPVRVPRQDARPSIPRTPRSSPAPIRTLRGEVRPPASSQRRCRPRCGARRRASRSRTRSYGARHAGSCPTALGRVRRLAAQPGPPGTSVPGAHPIRRSPDTAADGCARRWRNRSVRVAVGCDRADRTATWTLSAASPCLR